jgi:hypothetical protein
MKKLKPSNKTIKAVKDYGLAVVAAAVTMGIAMVTDLAPQYAILVGALAMPATKWANKYSKDYGIGSNN